MIMELNRRDFVKGLLATGALTVTGAAFSACSPSNTGDEPGTTTSKDGLAFTPGTYEASAPGTYGDVPVRVTVSETAIESIEVGENSETLGLGSVALRDIPQRIIETQSLSVDTLSGATLSSMAVINAARQALEQAGDNSAALNKPQTVVALTQGESETVDVVIVGAGLSGINAAYELAINHPSVSYVLLEKRDVITGSLPLSGGTNTAINSRLHTQMNTNCSTEDIIKLMRFATGGEPVRESLITDIYSTSETLFNRLLDWEIPLYEPDASKYYNPYVTENPVVANPMASDKVWTYFANGSGGGYSTVLQDHIKNNPLEFRTHSAVTDLIVSDGKVAGVKVTDKEKEYEIHARAVLFSCGGFGANPDLVKKYSPTFVNYISRTNSGATGDAFIMTEQFGTKVVGRGMIAGETMADSRYAAALGGYTALSVNTKAERTSDASGEEPVFVVFDGSFVDKEHIKPIESLESHLESGLAESFGTLEDLAKAKGIDAAALVKTVETYNAAIDAGESTGAKIATAPFYVERIFNSYSGSLPGLEVDDQMRVLDSKGRPVVGLYASGELTSGNIYYGAFPGTGIAGGYATFSGPFAITNIVELELG
jgi:fumarate reductase flavoprotein subunit